MPVYMIDDSGPYLENQYVPPGDTTAQAWNLAAALTSLQTNVLDALPNWKVFFMAGDTHTALVGQIDLDTPCGRGITSVSGAECTPTLAQWLSDELGAATWDSATPPPGVPGTQESFPQHPQCAIGN